jgi:hypothetical protein
MTRLGPWLRIAVLLLAPLVTAVPYFVLAVLATPLNLIQLFFVWALALMFSRPNWFMFARRWVAPFDASALRLVTAYGGAVILSLPISLWVFVDADGSTEFLGWSLVDEHLSRLATYVWGVMYFACLYGVMRVLNEGLRPVEEMVPERG